MELVGKALAYRGEHDDLRVVFRCANKEVFNINASPALDRIPVDLLVRVWTRRPEDDLGMPLKENVLVHWEKF